jgi:hypothetical protein
MPRRASHRRWGGGNALCLVWAGSDRCLIIVRFRCGEWRVTVEGFFGGSVSRRRIEQKGTVSVSPSWIPSRRPLLSVPRRASHLDLLVSDIPRGSVVPMIQVVDSSGLCRESRLPVVRRPHFSCRKCGTLTGFGPRKEALIEETLSRSIGAMRNRGRRSID